MTRIAAIVEVVELEEAETRAIPSQVEVTHAWMKTKQDLETIDQLFGRILQRLRRLRRWQLQGHVDSLRIEEVTEHNGVLLDWLRRLQEFVVDTALDAFLLHDSGSGI